MTGNVSNNSENCQDFDRNHGDEVSYVHGESRLPRGEAVITSQNRHDGYLLDIIRIIIDQSESDEGFETTSMAARSRIYDNMRTSRSGPSRSLFIRTESSRRQPSHYYLNNRRSVRDYVAFSSTSSGNGGLRDDHESPRSLPASPPHPFPWHGGFHPMEEFLQNTQPRSFYLDNEPRFRRIDDDVFSFESRVSAEDSSHENDRTR